MEEYKKQRHGNLIFTPGLLMITPLPTFAPNIRSNVQRNELKGKNGLMKKNTLTQCHKKNLSADAPRSNSFGLNLLKSVLSCSINYIEKYFFYTYQK